VSAQTRQAARAALQKARGFPLLTYVTSRRENFPTFVSGDALSYLYEHLRRIAPKRLSEVDLFLMTIGGDVTVPLPFVNLIREYSDKLNVLVAAECFSAGTMIALGADSVVMTPLAHLSPIDPTVNHPLNPISHELETIPPQPDGSVLRRLVGIEVEQVFSFLSLAHEKAKITDPNDLARVFEKLCDAVHPITLGEIHRIHSLIRVVGRRLLALHMKDNAKIDAIIEALTEKLFTHGYKIGRSEARSDLKLPVVSADTALEAAIMAVRDGYVLDAKMDEPFNLLAEAQVALNAAGANATSATVSLGVVFIESDAGEAIFTAERGVALDRSNPASPQIKLASESNIWRTRFN
jgi:hypothetical protein